MTSIKTVESHHQMPALAALALILLTGVGASAIEPPITPRAGADRVPAVKPPPSSPTPMVQRGLILSTGMLDVYVGPLTERPTGDNAFRRGSTVGAIWGFLPEMQADFQIGPFYLSPDVAPGTSRLTILGRIAKTAPIDVGASFATIVDPYAPRIISYVQPGVPAIVRPSKDLRVDTGLYLPVYTTSDPHLGLRVPVNVYFQISDRVHFGVTSTYVVTDLRDRQATTSIPVGLTGGYSAGPELGYLAITPYVTWTNFYTPHNGSVETRSFIAGVIADAPIQLP